MAHMTEGPQEDSPPQFEARLLLEVKASGHTTVSMGPEDLHIRAPFGDLVIPYTRMKKVTRDATGGIRLEAEGATLWLDASKYLDRTALFALLEEKIQEGEH